jgi:hypothetical protein
MRGTRSPRRFAGSTRCLFLRGAILPFRTGRPADGTGPAAGEFMTAAAGLALVVIRFGHDRFLERS